MKRGKGKGKDALEEARRLAREAAKNGGKAEGWPEQDELHGCLMLIIRILSKMAESAGMQSNADLDISSAIPLMEDLTKAYSQKTVNTALLFLFRHLDNGIVKIGSESDDVERTPSEEEKSVLAHRIFYLSFAVNGMFLVNG